MHEIEAKQRKIFGRKYFQKIESPNEDTDETYLSDVTLFDLLLAFKKALDNMPKVTYHEVKMIDVTIEQQTEYILQKISDQTMILFSELINEIKEKIVIVVTFLALLEMIRTKIIVVRQSSAFEDIRIKKVV